MPKKQIFRLYFDLSPRGQESDEPEISAFAIYRNPYNRDRKDGIVVPGALFACQLQ